MGIAKAAIAAARQKNPISCMSKIGNQGLVVLLEDLGSDRHLEDDSLPGRAVALAPHAMAAGLGLEMLPVSIVDQGVEAFDRLGMNIPAAATIAAIRPTELDELLPPEADRSRAPIAGANVNLRLIEELQLAARRANQSARVSTRSQVSTTPPAPTDSCISSPTTR